MWGPYDLQIVDKVVIPKDLPAGEYVLGWRWDCEESSQVWQTCSDITIEAAEQTSLIMRIFEWLINKHWI